jgi:basic amino acid/polyamine antiporter, APA family
MSLTATAVHATKRETRIGLVTCIAFAVGNMVGAGVFVLSGPAVMAAGPAALISFGIAGVSVLLSALSFSVVASLAPEGSSGYAYVSQALSRYWGFITSWAFYMGGIIGAAFVLNSFGIYLQQFFFPGLNPLMLSIGAAVLLTILNLGSASAIGKAETFLVFIKVLILVGLIVFGLAHFNTGNLHPFAPHGWGVVMHQSGQLFVAYLGFSVVTSMAGDVRNASRTVPTAILLSMLIVAVIYTGVALALINAHLPVYNESSVGTAAAVFIGTTGQTVVAVGALISILSCANANILGSSEVMVRLAAKSEVPSIAGKLWHGHPFASVLFGAIIYLALMLVGKSGTIVSIANVTAIVMMLLVNISAFIALKQKKVYPGWYPWGLIIPVLGLITAITQAALIGWTEVLISLLFIFSGSLFYLLRKKFHHQPTKEDLEQKLKHNDGPAGRALSDFGQKQLTHPFKKKSTHPEWKVQH